jgi:hypothetical protein
MSFIILHYPVHSSYLINEERFNAGKAKPGLDCIK